MKQILKIVDYANEQIHQTKVDAAAAHWTHHKAQIAELCNRLHTKGFLSQ